jgi:hypothetical protein
MTVRTYALDFLNRATNGARGVARGDAPYERVTEGRHVDGLFYSACGDLANALLFACGIRQPSYVNRAENGSYRIGWNVAKLDSLANSLRNYSKQPITHNDILALQPGDITIVWNRADTTDAHVAAVRSVGQFLGEPNDILYTSDYGQGSPFDGKQNARHVSGTLIGSRKLQRIIKLDEAVKRYATAEPIPLDVYFGAAPASSARPTLRKGDKGEAVKTLQRWLSVRLKLVPPLALDGDLGPKTDAAVRDFQSTYSLTVDGVVGPKTWGALESK